MRRFALILTLLLSGGGALAQEARPILTLQSDRLFDQSQFGQRIQAEIERAFQELSVENRQIEAELEAEERDLTRRRAQMTAEEFRPLAEAFDEKVVEIRRTQEAKNRQIATRSEEGFQAFMQVAVPILGTLMAEHGAEVILESRSVFLSAQRIDITAEALARIDEAIGDGSGMDAGPPEDAGAGEGAAPFGDPVPVAPPVAEPGDAPADLPLIPAPDMPDRATPAPAD